MKKISVHDYFISGYSVLCSKRKIRLQAEYRERGETHERVEVVFSGVLAYLFWRDNLDTILFDIYEIPLPDVLKMHELEFREGERYMWPGTWNESPEKCLEYLKSENARAWCISSSYGMGGFVFGREIAYIKKK